jgi:hypothetical protein
MQIAAEPAGAPLGADQKGTAMRLGAGAGGFHLEGVDCVDEVVLYVAGRSTSPTLLAYCKPSRRHWPAIAG